MFSQEGMPLYLQSLPVIKADLFESQGIHALIGQDVLERCTLVHSGQDKILHLMWSDDAR